MSNVAGNEGSGDRSDSDEEEQERPVTREYSTPRSTSRYNGENRYATCTESLGFESMNETEGCDDHLLPGTSSIPSQAVENDVGVEFQSRSIKRRQKSSSSQRKEFPPLLSTLNKNGRPRFDLVKVRENGRLQVQVVQKERPELVEAVKTGDRVTLTFSHGENQDCTQDDDELEEASIENDESRVESSTSDSDEREQELHRGDLSPDRG